MVDSLRIATRASTLAQAQAAHVAAALAASHPGLQVEALLLRTVGDLRLEDPLHAIGGKGLFTREIDEALLDGRADLAVHSLKDLPTTLHPDLFIAAVPLRESDADVLVLPAPVDRGLGGDGGAEDGVRRMLPQLRDGAVVATGSLRRGAQLLRMRPDLRLAPVRGNIDTRLRKLREEGWAGLVLAEAGLQRLGRMDEPRVPLNGMLPAAGQGALACMIRADDARTRALVEPLHHAASGWRVWAERTCLASLGAGCHAPVGVRTRFLGDGRLHLRGGIFSQDGTGALLAEGIAEAGGRIDVNVIDDDNAFPSSGHGIHADMDSRAGASPMIGTMPHATRAAWESLPREEASRVADALGAAVAQALLERGAGRILAKGTADA